MNQGRDTGVLESSEYRTVFHNSSDGIFVHPPDSDEILDVNERFAEMLGYSREELLNMRVSDVTADDWEPPASPAEMVRQARREERATFEWRDQRKDGTTFPVEVNLTLVDLGGEEHVLASVRDITERKRQERRARAVFDQTYQFIGLLEPDGTVLDANETALEFGDLDREDVVGKPFWECYWWRIDDRTQRELRDAVRRAAGGEFVRYEVEVQGGATTEVIDFSIRPVADESGEVTLLIPEGRVISELVAQRERLDVYNRVMRHNVRNQLAVVDGLVDEIRDRTDDGRIAEFADRALSATDRVCRITEQIREFDRLREAERAPERLDLPDLLGDLATDHGTGATTVRTAVEPGLTVSADRRLLRLVVEQLLENAVEHGGSTVRLSAASVPEGVEIEVRDDGPGISPGEYEPALSTEPTQLEHSTGIGLSIVKWAVDELGGEVDCESEPDAGTTVRVRLPDDRQ